jgi:hypothetical protein
MIAIAPKLLAAGAAMLLVGAGGGIAMAAMTSKPSPIDSSGVIHGCWTKRDINGTHVFMLQDAGTKCPGGTTAISWNQKGPAGPPGSPGAAGRSQAVAWPSSLDQLNGIPCEHGAGTTRIGYGNDGAVSIRCINPNAPVISASATPSPTPTVTHSTPPTSSVPYTTAPSSPIPYTTVPAYTDSPATRPSSMEPSTPAAPPS